MGKETRQQQTLGSWKPNEELLAVWMYRRMDLDRTMEEDWAVSELAQRLDRNPEHVRALLRNVAACDPRPSSSKPVREDWRIQGKLRLVFDEFWRTRTASSAKAEQIWKSGLRPPAGPAGRGLNAPTFGEAKTVAPEGGRPESVQELECIPPPHSQGHAGWTSDEYLLAVYMFERIQRDRNFSEEKAGRILSNLIGRELVEVQRVIRGVATCSKLPITFGTSPDKRYASEPLRQVYREYMSSPISGPARAQALLNQLKARKALSTPGGAVPAPPVNGSGDPHRNGLKRDVPWESWDGRLPALRQDEEGFFQAFKKISSLSTLPAEMARIRREREAENSGLTALGRVAQELQARLARLRLPPPPDPHAHERAWRRWIDHDRSLAVLNFREIRIICQKPETGMNPEWIKALATPGGPMLRRSWIEALLSHYFARWRDFEQAERLEVLLRDLLDRLPSRQAWTTGMSKEIRPLIGPEASSRLVRPMKDPLRDYEAVLDRWDLDRTVGLGRAVLMGALSAWLQELAKVRSGRTDADVAEELKEAFSGLLQEAVIPEDAFRTIVSDIVLSERLKSPALREVLLPLLLQHARLGDPRRQKHHWFAIPLARDRVVSWMAAKDLRIFYDKVVSDHQDDQGRKAFWLRFVESVVDFRLVLSEEDSLRLKSQLGNAGVRFATMEGTNKPSAFILRFRSSRSEDDLICVEFSQTGNSLYVYDASSFEAGVGSMQAPTFRIGSEPRNLKNREYCRSTIRHAGYWQYEAQQFLQSHGILAT